MRTQPALELTPPLRFARERAVLLGKIPTPVLARLVRPWTNRAGDVMSPEIAVMMRMADGAGDYSDLDPVASREAIDAEAELFTDFLPPMNFVEELKLPNGLAATHYRPSATVSGLLVFFHGGGFVVGSRAGYDSPARFLAHHSGLDVLSVDYRLAPEHPFPAAHEDALSAWDYAVAMAQSWGVPESRIGIGGDSAGGHMAAVLAQQLRGRDVQPAVQVLIYPWLDLLAYMDSHEEFVDMPGLTSKQLAWFRDLYLAEGIDRSDPRVSPLGASGLSGLPTAIVTAAGFDPLRDEAVAYADRLRDAGVHTRLLREESLVHGYIGFTAVSRASAEATKRVAEAMVEVMRSGAVQTAPQN